MTERFNVKALAVWISYGLIQRLCPRLIRVIEFRGATIIVGW
jgi:hypothetical protein